MNKIKLSIAMVLWFTVVACATHYAVDPNANTVVTVQYDDEPERIVLPEKGCKPQLDCTGTVSNTHMTLPTICSV